MRYRVPPGLAWQVVEEDELTIYLMPLPDGDPVALRGVGALIWVAAIEGEDAVATIVEATRQPREAIEATVLDYLGQLVAAGHLALVREPA